MQVQIEEYIEKMLTYKKPLFIHGIGNFFTEILEEIKQFKKNNFLLFLRSFGLSDRIFYLYKYDKRGIPVSLLFNILNEYKKITKKDTKEITKKIFLNFCGINSRSNRPINLPKFYSKELAYLCGFILGDGHVSKRLEVIIWEETEEHTKYIVGLIERLFEYKPIVIKEKNYNIICIYSSPVHFFFTKVIGFVEGKKKSKEIVPEFINLNLEFKTDFLRGLFDSDGGVTISKKGKKSILLSSSNDKLLNKIALLLKNFDINLSMYKSGNKRGFELRSFNLGEIKKFNEKIGFIHPIKHLRAIASVA